MLEDQRDRAPVRLSDFKIVGAVLFILLIVLAFLPTPRTMPSSEEQLLPITQEYGCPGDTPEGRRLVSIFRDKDYPVVESDLKNIYSSGTLRTHVRLKIRVLSGPDRNGVARAQVLEIDTPGVPKTIKNKPISLRYGGCVHPAKVGESGSVYGGLFNERTDEASFFAF